MLYKIVKVNTINCNAKNVTPIVDIIDIVQIYNDIELKELRQNIEELNTKLQRMTDNKVIINLESLSITNAKDIVIKLSAFNKSFDCFMIDLLTAKKSSHSNNCDTVKKCIADPDHDCIKTKCCHWDKNAKDCSL